MAAEFVADTAVVLARSVLVVVSPFGHQGLEL